MITIEYLMGKPRLMHPLKPVKFYQQDLINSMHQNALGAEVTHGGSWINKSDICGGREGYESPAEGGAAWDINVVTLRQI